MVHYNNLNKFSFLKIIGIFVCILLFTNNLTAQNSKVSQENSNSSVTSFDENSTDYFNNTDSVSSDSGNGRRENRSSARMFVRMILVLIFICGLIYLFVWLLKRKTNIPASDNEYLRRAAYISIGQNKTVEVITLIDKAYLIGTTEDNITLLGEIDDKELIQAMNLSADKKQNVKNPVNFSEVLDMFTKKTKKSSESLFAQSERNIDAMINEEDEEKSSDDGE